MGIKKYLKNKILNWSLKDNYPMWMVGSGSYSGEAVSPTTAMQLTAVYGCVKIIAETVAQLPLHTYKLTADGNKERALQHPIYFKLHDEPNPYMTSFVFRETIMSHLLLWGNSYSQIIRNGKGEIIALYPLMPQRMDIVRSSNGKILYVYTQSNDDLETNKPKTVILSREEILHIPGLSFDGLVGYSPISMLRNPIGAAIAADKSSGKFYSNAAMPSGVIEYPGSINDPKAFREKWNEAFSGAINSGKTPVLEEGMKYHQISINPSDAQFLETRKFNINEIARIFRVPPHMLADLEKSSFSNIEQQSLEFVKYTIEPWIVRIEQALKKDLLLSKEKENLFFSFNLEGLLRGDYQSRMNGYAIARQNGWMSSNDIRELENMNKISAEEGGDLYLVNGNMLKLNKAGAFANNGGKEVTEQ